MGNNRKIFAPIINNQFRWDLDMLFSSMTFIFIFLPIVCLLNYLLGKKHHNIILLIASIIFYAWGEPIYVFIMLSTILINYFGAILVSKDNKNKKLWLTLSIVLNLGILFYFKYFNFFIYNLNHFLDKDFNFIKVIMPIGISFYTFQAMSYLIDVYRQEAPVQKNIFNLTLYISLFPQLVAGPIVKYHDIDQQLTNRTITFSQIIIGVKRFIIGLSKKTLIANTCGEVADKIFTLPVEQFDTLTSWIGAIFYSLQLFFDFSGYSDMAIGLGLIFGFKFLENFNYPYISKSITEFWRRWHISLSTWFKLYLYIPLGGNRCGAIRTYINLFIVFLATGFWHGASWNFIFWGLWHGIFIIFEKITNWHQYHKNKFISITQHIYTILIFIIGWVMFRAEDMSYATQYIKNMFGLIQEHKIAYSTSYFIDNISLIALFAGIICSMPIFNRLIYNNKPIIKALTNCWLIFLFLLSFASIAASTYNPFIYFRF